DGQVQEIAKNDLDDEDHEHGRQHCSEHILGTRIEPAPDALDYGWHGKSLLPGNGPPGEEVRQSNKTAARSGLAQSALMRSTTPSGQSLASSDSRYFCWAKARKAARSGS